MLPLPSDAIDGASWEATDTIPTARNRVVQKLMRSFKIYKIIKLPFLLLISILISRQLQPGKPVGKIFLSGRVHDSCGSREVGYCARATIVYEYNCAGGRKANF